MSDLTQTATQSVKLLHQLIEDIFDGARHAIAECLNHFADDFVMVTPSGKSLTLNEVAALFSELAGARKGMTIVIEDCQVITQSEREVVIQYREVQQMAGQMNVRISLAVIDCTTQPPRWRYLQETRVAD